MMRTTMDGPEIVQLTNSDIAFGKKLTDLEGWHRTSADWSRLLRIEPLGMMKAQLDGRDVGIAGVLSYEGVSWIHSIIVLPEFRRRGVGSALMQDCIARARDSGSRCIKLDSVHGFEGFYKRFGFVEEFESRRYVRDCASFPVSVDRVQSSDVDDLLAFDRENAGIDRGRVLHAILEDYPELAFCIRDGSRILGYALAREGEERLQIGPCVVETGDTAVARKLITSIMGSVAEDERFRMCVPGMNERAVKLAADLGFDYGQSPTRMYLGEPFHEPVETFCMISPEKG